MVVVLKTINMANLAQLQVKPDFNLTPTFLSSPDLDLSSTKYNTTL